MSQIKQTGTPEVQELKIRREKTPKDGWRSWRRWRGTEAAINGFIPRVDGPGVRINIVPEDGGALVTLEASFDNAQDGSSVNGDTQILTRWEMDGLIVEKDIFASPQYQAIVDSGEGSDIAELQLLRADHTRTGGADLITPNAIALAPLIRRGEESYQRSSYVLRKTQTLSALSIVAFDVNLVGEQFTPDQLILAEPTIPERYQVAMEIIGGAWLKQTPKSIQQSNGKFEDTVEYWWGVEIATLFYPKVP